MIPASQQVRFRLMERALQGAGGRELLRPGVPCLCPEDTPAEDQVGAGLRDGGNQVLKLWCDPLV